VLAEKTNLFSYEASYLKLFQNQLSLSASQLIETSGSGSANEFAGHQPLTMAQHEVAES